jgi:hypothetical protein
MRIRNWFDLCINVFQNGGAEAEAQTGQNTRRKFAGTSGTFALAQKCEAAAISYSSLAAYHPC